MLEGIRQAHMSEERRKEKQAVAKGNEKVSQLQIKLCAESNEK